MKRFDNVIFIHQVRKTGFTVIKAQPNIKVTIDKLNQNMVKAIYEDVIG